MRIIRTNSLSPTLQKVLSAVLILITFVVFVYAVYTILPVHEDANPPLTWGFSVDWKGCLRPATIRLFSGETLYQGCGFNPPWTYILLGPIALLPPALGAVVMFVLSYMIYTFVLLRMGAKPLMIVAFLICPFPLINALNGNIDFLPLLGFILPPWLGLFFLSIKPQIGAGLALFYIFEAWHKGKWNAVIKLITPITVAFLLSFAIFGFYPLKLINMPSDPYNSSLFPSGLLIGLPLLVYALKTRQKLLSIAATPLLAPYINIHSYAIFLFAFLPYEAGFYIAVALSMLAFR